MQLDFQDPLYVSIDTADILQITVLPPALRYFQTLGSRLLIRNPFKTLSMHLPPQTYYNTETIAVMAKTVELASQTSQYAALTNLGV